MAIKAVFFDVGETLVDETRMWLLWADWMQVPYGTFLTVLGGVIAQGRSHRDVFTTLSPSFDFEAESAKKRSAGKGYRVESRDLYPDAMPCLAELRAAGYLVGIAGNQPQETETALNELEVPVDIVASSARWRVRKPSLDFFARIAQVSVLEPQEVAYVGDRLDNDVLPAQAVGMTGVFLKRGPWGYRFADHPDAAEADIRIDSLDELPDILQRLAT